MMIHKKYLIFKPVFKHFLIFSGTVDKILGWKSKLLSEESIATPVTSDHSFAPKLTYIHNSNIAVKFEEHYLKQEKVNLLLKEMQ